MTWTPGFDIAYSRLTPQWAAAAYARGMRVFAVDLWTGGLANDPTLHNQSGPSLLAGIGASLIPIGYINANPQAWGDAGATWEAPSAVAHAIANAGATWPILLAHGFIAVDVEIEGTTWPRVQALIAELIRVGFPSERILIYTGAWFVNGHIGRPPADIAARPLWTTGTLAQYQATPYGFTRVVGCQTAEVTEDGVTYDQDTFDLDYYGQNVPAGTTSPPPQEDDMIQYEKDAGAALAALNDGDLVHGAGDYQDYRISKDKDGNRRKHHITDVAVATREGIDLTAVKEVPALTIALLKSGDDIT